MKKTKLTTDEAMELAERLRDVVASGMPLGDGLRLVANEVKRRRLRAVVLRMATALDEGQPVESCAAGIVTIPRFLAGLLASGARSGRLATTLTSVVEYYRRSSWLWRRFCRMTSYPMFLIILLLAVTILVSVVLIPSLVQVFEEWEIVELPTATRGLIWIGASGWKYALAAAGVLSAAMILLRVFGGRGAWMRLVASLPGIGPLFHWQGYAELCRLVHLLLREEVPLPEALTLAADGVHNANVSETSRRLSHAVARGAPLGESMANDRQVPEVLVQIVQLGEQQNQLCEAFDASAETLQGYIELRAQVLTVVVPPVALVLIAAAAVTLIAGVLSPLVYVIQALS